MRVLERPCQGFRAAGNQDQMHVVGHEAVAEQREFVQLNGVAQQFQVGRPLAVFRKQELPGVAPLRHVVRNINDCDTCQTRHQRARVSENVPSVPGFPVPGFQNHVL